ncbi:uncharacterized protein LOC144630275 [Oculina patagonica]
MNRKFWLSVAFLMSRIGIFEAALQCDQGENSIGQMYLRGHTFKTYKVGWPHECFLWCDEEVTCQSFNFHIGQKVCELNNRTKEARPEDFLPDRTKYYMKRANNRVPLGSIPELPAESCSEIKACEGNEMVNGDYWIYSDGNGQTIQAHCEENWQKINTKPVCFGARDNQYGSFNITKNGRLKAMKLIHKSGAVRCNQVYSASYWGCRSPAYGGHGLMTFITNANEESVLPPAGVLKAVGDCGNRKYFYSLDGTSHTSPELVFSDLSHLQSVSRNQELQIWYGQDLYDCGEDNNSVPLGSIPELPAESCSEIKASEENEMVNGNYWIYSDGNGQTILARCEENWQKINIEPVCFGARGNQYGAFNITKSGRLRTMKLIYKSGSIKCNPKYSASYWGCRNLASYGNNGLLTIITNAKKEAVLPPAGDLQSGCGNKRHYYSLDGTSHTSPELVFRDLSNPLTVSRKEELQIWYGQDWIDCSDDNNSGKTCVDVYAWYA